MTSRRHRAARAAAELSARRLSPTCRTFPDPQRPGVFHEVRGLILDYYQRHYDELHGVEDLQKTLERFGRDRLSGAFGAPVGAEQPVTWGQAWERGFDREQPFEGGTIFLDSANGRLDAVRHIVRVKFIPGPQYTFDSSASPRR